MIESFDHDVHSCPYRDYADAICASLRKTIHGLIDKMIETMKERIDEYSPYFNQSREDYNLHKDDSS